MAQFFSFSHFILNSAQNDISSFFYDIGTQNVLKLKGFLYWEANSYTKWNNSYGIF